MSAGPRNNNSLGPRHGALRSTEPTTRHNPPRASSHALDDRHVRPRAGSFVRARGLRALRALAPRRRAPPPRHGHDASRRRSSASAPRGDVRPGRQGPTPVVDRGGGGDGSRAHQGRGARAQTLSEAGAERRPGRARAHPARGGGIQEEARRERRVVRRRSRRRTRRRTRRRPRQWTRRRERSRRTRRRREVARRPAPTIRRRLRASRPPLLLLVLLRPRRDPPFRRLRHRA